jgi:amino acid transporter
LGGFSFINSMVAVLWMIFIVVLLFFPTYQTPNAEQMNNAIVVVGFVVVFCLSYYCFPKYGGKTFFDEPVRTINSKEKFLWKQLLQDIDVTDNDQSIVYN